MKPFDPISILRPHMAVAAVAAAVLAACGGGGDDSSSGSTGGGTVTPSLTLSGVAATGAAMSGATVTAHCATGNGSAPSNSDGSFTITVSAGALPCVLEAATSTTTLHSVVTGDTSASAATVNVTPLTELLVAQLTGADPATLFSNAATASADLASVVTTASVESAQASVLSVLADAGVDTSSVSSILSGSLTAGSGQGYDGVLDTLASTLASTSSSLSELVSTVATSAAGSSASSTTGSSDETASTSLLPAALLLKAKAATCSALRSVDYRFMVLKASASSPAAPITSAATMDAAAAGGPVLAWADGSTETLVPVDGDACHFTIPTNADGFSADVMVAPSGVIVARALGTWTDGEAQADTNYRLLVGVPVQTVTVSELAGDWNVNGWSWDNTAGKAGIDSAILTLDSNGAGTSKCDASDPSLATANCTVNSATYSVSANSAGGFDFSGVDGGDSWTSRVYAYRAGNGKTMLVGLDSDGSFVFATRVAALSLPSVGETHSTWNATVNQALQSTDALAGNGFAITSVGSDSFVRTATVLSTGVSHSQTLSINSPRDGWQHRAAGTATGSDASTVTIREMYGLPLGVGITAYYLPANNNAGSNGRFGLSVRKPS